MKKLVLATLIAVLASAFAQSTSWEAATQLERKTLSCVHDAHTTSLPVQGKWT